MSVRIGVVIPTLDGGERFAACLEAVSQQTASVVGVVVVDSQSSDGTPDRARAAGARVEEIDRADFDHGATRTLGASLLPEVDVIVFLVQDAVPLGAQCFEALVQPFDDPAVGATTARQVAPEGASLLTQSTVSSSPFASEDARRVGPFASEVLSDWDASRWRGAVLLDDVACAVRADVFLSCGGYPATDHGEDVLLAYDLLWAGWSLAHAPAAVVSHGHEYDAETVFARYRDDAVFFRERFGLRVRPTFFSMMKGFASELRRDARILSTQSPQDTTATASGRRAVRWSQVRAQRAGSRGPLGSLPKPRPMPSPAHELR